MTRRRLHIFAPALAIVLLCGFIAQSATGDDRMQLRKDEKGQAAEKISGSRSISGVFSGKLEGFVSVGGQNVLITKNTVLYMLGKGLLSKGTNVSNASLFVSSSVKNSIPTASLIIVRSGKGLGEKNLGMMIKDAKHRRPGESDPNVGVLDAAAPQ